MRATMAVTRENLMQLLEPAVAGLGFEIVDLEVNLRHAGGLLRVFIDSPRGVTVDDCEAVSRRVSGVLDVANPIAGGYRLEISSPGLDRRLVKAEHYDRFVGSEVAIKLRRLIDGRRRLRGTLLARVGEVIEIGCEGACVRVPLAEIDVTRLVPDLKVPARH